MSKSVLFMALLGSLVAGFIGCGDGSSGTAGAGGVGPLWYPGTCVLTEEASICDFPPCKEDRTYTYDGDGKLVAYTYDDKADGTMDYKVAFTYNADEVVTEHHDIDADGTVDRTYTPDPNNKGWREGLESICRQSPGQRITIGEGTGVFVITCDTNGKLVKEEWATSVTTYTYDGEGRLLRKERVGDDPYLTTYTYDGEGRLLREERVGNKPNLITYTYEPDGTGWTSEYDRGTDGDVDWRATCTCGECDWNHEH